MALRDQSRYGCHELHLAVWHGDTSAVRSLLDSRISPNAMDRDGQTAWDWAEARGKDYMMDILREYGGGPKPVWSLKLEPRLDEKLNHRKVSLINLAGETVLQADFREDDSVESFLATIEHETGRSATVVLPNNYVIGLPAVGDGHLTLSNILDNPPVEEKRKDPIDGRSYTKKEFFKYYGFEEGQEKWSMVEPDIDEVVVARARAESLKELAQHGNALVSEAISRSREDARIRILVMQFNKISLDFTNAICDSPVAVSLLTRGVDISPAWANGAKILVDGLTPLMMEEGAPSFDPSSLRRSHIVVLENYEEDVMNSVRALSYRKRPRPKTVQFMTCQATSPNISSREESTRDGSDSSEQQEVDNSEAAAFAKASQHSPLGSITSALPEDFSYTRTFIDVTEHLRVGWSPRSAFTKSSNDRHGIENPRKWVLPSRIMSI